MIPAYPGIMREEIGPVTPAYPGITREEIGRVIPAYPESRGRR